MERRAVARPLKLAIVIALFCAAVATPCSFDYDPRLYYDIRPDAPIARFVDGHLGILQPGYARSHLVVAFRHLSGKPPSAVERQGFTELLEHRLDEQPRVRAAEEWERLRATVRGVPFQVQAVPEHTKRIEGDFYQWIDNCTDDAFRIASSTLAARVKTFGATDPAVDAWLDAQEIVFSNCSEGEASVPEVSRAMPEIIRADRQYQIAAADFYAVRYDDARKRFLRIASDSKSPWRTTARLVAARALIRGFSVGGMVEEQNPLAKAQEELEAILADKAMAEYHDVAWGLLAYTVAHSDAQARFDEAAQGLLKGEPTVRRARTDLADYTLLWEKEGVTPGNHELATWINAFKNGDTKLAAERWRATKRAHWLVAALTHAKPEDAAAAGLLRDSATIAPESPAFVSVTHHRVRLMKDADARRNELDRVLAREIPVSARNQLLAQRRGLARNLAELLRDTPVSIVGAGLEAGTYEGLHMPPDATFAFNFHMPLATLQKASTDEAFAPDVRTRVARATRVRAALLANPDFDLAYATAKDLLADPYVLAFNRGDERPNWWCKGGPSELEVAAPPVPPFLIGNEAASAETARLEQLGSGASWILRTTLARAKSHPDDPRVPEALALAIDGTRWACGDEDTDRLAEQAFTLLKKRYPSTKWAQQTRYWHRAAF